MSPEQQDQCLGLLLAIAMDGSCRTKDDLQRTVKQFLSKLPAEDLARVASLPMEFSTVDPGSA